MAAINADCGGQPLIDMTLCGAGVRVFGGEVFDSENRVAFDKPLDLRGSVIRRSVDEKDYPFEVVPLGMCYEVVQVFSELDVSSAWEAVPHYFLLRPEEGDETVHSFCVAECRNVENAALRYPATLNSREEFDPLFVLEDYCDPFFKRALATRLYRLISARLR